MGNSGSLVKVQQCSYAYVNVKPSVFDIIVDFCDGHNDDSCVIWMSNLLENKSADWVMENIPEVVDLLEMDVILFLISR